MDHLWGRATQDGRHNLNLPAEWHQASLICQSLASVHAFGVQRDEAPMWQMCKQALTAEPHSLAGAVISRAWLGGTSQGTCQLQEPPMKPQQGLTLI